MTSPDGADGRGEVPPEIASAARDACDRFHHRSLAASPGEPLEVRHLRLPLQVRRRFAAIVHAYAPEPFDPWEVFDTIYRDELQRVDGALDDEAE